MVVVVAGNVQDFLNGDGENELRVVMEGTTGFVYLNDELVLTFEDADGDAPRYGRVGVYTYVEEGGSFDQTVTGFVVDAEVFVLDADNLFCLADRWLTVFGEGLDLRDGGCVVAYDVDRLPAAGFDAVLYVLGDEVYADDFSVQVTLKDALPGVGGLAVLYDPVTGVRVTFTIGQNDGEPARAVVSVWDTELIVELGSNGAPLLPRKRMVKYTPLFVQTTFRVS